MQSGLFIALATVALLLMDGFPAYTMADVTAPTLEPVAGVRGGGSPSGGGGVLGRGGGGSVAPPVRGGGHTRDGWHHHDGHHHHGHGGVDFWFGPGWGNWWWDGWWGGYPYYPYPYNYPYNNPPAETPQQYQAVEPQEPSYWYFCPDPQGFFPYVKKCPKGWLKVVPKQVPEGEGSEPEPGGEEGE